MTNEEGNHKTLISSTASSAPKDTAPQPWHTHGRRAPVRAEHDSQSRGSPTCPAGSTTLCGTTKRGEEGRRESWRLHRRPCGKHEHGHSHEEHKPAPKQGTSPRGTAKRGARARWKPASTRQPQPGCGRSAPHPRPGGATPAPHTDWWASTALTPPDSAEGPSSPRQGTQPSRGPLPWAAQHGTSGGTGPPAAAAPRYLSSAAGPQPSDGRPRSASAHPATRHLSPAQPGQGVAALPGAHARPGACPLPASRGGSGRDPVGGSVWGGGSVRFGSVRFRAGLSCAGERRGAKHAVQGPGGRYITAGLVGSVHRRAPVGGGKAVRSRWCP